MDSTDFGAIVSPVVTNLDRAKPPREETPRPAPKQPEPPTRPPFRW